MEMNEVNVYEDYDRHNTSGPIVYSANTEPVAAPPPDPTWPAAAIPPSISLFDEVMKNIPADYKGDILPDYGLPDLGLKNPYFYGEDHPQIVEDQKHFDIPYLFQESRYVKEAWDHIDGTYSTHYAGAIQPTQVIIDAGHGTGFNIGNIIKYAKRYGKKEGYNRKDLLKIIHYAVMQLYVHDKEGL